MMFSPSKRGVLVAALAATMCGAALCLRADDRAPAAAPVSTVAAATPAELPDRPRTRMTESAVTPRNRSPKRHAELLARKAQGSIDLLFLGASVVEWWPRNGAESWAKLDAYHPADFGAAGECTEDILWRITHDELDGLHPRVVVLMAGGNNVGQHWDEEPAWVVAGMRKIVDVIHEKLPDAKLLLLGIFPRDGKDSSNRQRCEAVNVELAKFADGDKTRYLDIGKVFLDERGEIPKEIMPDSLHPSAKGYGMWYEAINPTLAELMR